MELELLPPNDQELKNNDINMGRNSCSFTIREKKTVAQKGDDDDLCHCPKSMKTLGMELSMKSDDHSSAEKKLNWLRCQMIGEDAEFDSPFGKRRLLYADTTASGRSLQYIEDFIIANVLPFYGNTHTSDSYVGHRTTQMVKEATMYIKNCLGGNQEADALLFCGAGSTAAIKRLQEVMGISVPSILRERVIRSLSDEERWVVFVGPHEHHSNLLSWRQSIAEVVHIGLDGNGLLDMEDLRLKLEGFKYSNRPLLGSFSACSNVTGIYSDTRAIARLLHQYGAFACFDFAASGPYVEIDMRSGEMEGYDVVFLSAHKFLGGPGTPGILLMNTALYQLKSSAPSTCGGGTVDYVNPFTEEDTLYYDDIEERENGGTPQITQIIRAALAFWVKEYISYPVIEKQEHDYNRRALDRLSSNKNICVLGNTSVKRQATLSFLIYSTTNSSMEEKLYMWSETGSRRYKPLHGPFVASLLSDLFGIQARGGCNCAGPYGHNLLNIDQALSEKYRSMVMKGYSGIKPGWTRVNFPYYMSNEKFEFILAALEFIAVYGQRFLTLYDFNFRTGGWKLKKNAIDNLVVKKEKVSTNSVGKRASYLEAAQSIAKLLQKFPPPRKIPSEIDPDLLYFRV